jgi:hypothetical protein
VDIVIAPSVPATAHSRRPARSTASGSPTLPAVEIFVDPICPFAWLTSRWLTEVERLGRIELTIRIMSLSILNGGREDVTPFYRDLVDRAWTPARVGIAIERDHGSAALRAWYDELGHRIHVGGENGDDVMITDALSATGLPLRLLTDLEVDDAHGAGALLRASHQRAIDMVGADVGTPIVHIRDDEHTIAFFGPVVNPSPRGDEALRLWDGIELVAGTPGFFELKRTRTGPLVFE